MKKLILVPILLLSFFSCKKDTTEKSVNESQTGIAIDRGAPQPLCCNVTISWYNSNSFNGGNIKIYKRDCNASLCTLGTLVGTLTKSNPSFGYGIVTEDCVAECFTAVASVPFIGTPIVRVTDDSSYYTDYPVTDSGGTCVPGQSKAFSIVCNAG